MFKPKTIILILLILTKLKTFGQVDLDIIDYKTTRLNGLVPEYLSKKELIKLLGKPDKIEVFETDCALTEEQDRAKIKRIYYFEKTSYLIFDNKAELDEINFVSGRFTFKTPKINLSNKTTINELIKIFPKSMKDALPGKDGNLDIRIQPCNNCDTLYFLIFRKGKLVSLKVYNDC